LRERAQRGGCGGVRPAWILEGLQVAARTSGRGYLVD
jgi:hypothetical protein